MSKFLAPLTLAALVEVYNNLAAVVDETDVKRFASKEKAVERIEAILGRVNEYRYEEKLPLITLSEGGKLVVVEPKPVAKVAAAKVAPAAKVAAAKSAGRVAAVAPSDVIVLLVAAGTNPKFAGAADRFSKYVTGMTVADYIEALGDKKQALRDLNWDTKQKWVQVVGAKAAPVPVVAPVAEVAEISQGQLLLPAPVSYLMLPAPTQQLSA